MSVRLNFSGIPKSCKICTTLPKMCPKRFHTSTHRTTKSPSQIYNAQPTYQKWDNLTTKQKVIRTGSYGSNVAVIILGVGVFGIVAYTFTTFVLLPSSETRIFNKSFDLVKKNPEVVALLGSTLWAYGESTRSRWQKNRLVTAQKSVDKANREHLVMKYHVEGELASGICSLEMIKNSEGDYDYHYLFVEVQEPKKRIYIIDNRPKQQSSRGLFSIFRSGKK